MITFSKKKKILNYISTHSSYIISITRNDLRSVKYIKRDLKLIRKRLGKISNLKNYPHFVRDLIGDVESIKKVTDFPDRLRIGFIWDKNLDLRPLCSELKYLTIKVRSEQELSLKGLYIKLNDSGPTTCPSCKVVDSANLICTEDSEIVMYCDDCCDETCLDKESTTKELDRFINSLKY